MIWPKVQAGFFDELSKIAVSTIGLSQESVDKNSIPLPMFDTIGYQKAKGIIELADSIKLMDKASSNVSKTKKPMIKYSFTTPKMALKATKQVGGIKNIIHKGTTIRSQISGSLIGRRFVRRGLR